MRIKSLFTWMLHAAEILTLVGCTKKSAQEDLTQAAAAPPTSATMATVPTQATTQATPQAAASGASEAQFLAGLMERLDQEKKNRPVADPTVERVFDAISNQAKIAFEDQKQVAGWTIGARYCMKGVTKNDVHVVVCEYTDVPTATKGVEAASATNKVIKRREVLSKRATTLSIQQAGESKAAEADATKISQAFRAM